MSGKEEVQKAEGQLKVASKKRRVKRLSIWHQIANAFNEVDKEGNKVVRNRNKTYARYGVGGTNPIYIPRRGKFKGYMR